MSFIQAVTALQNDSAFLSELFSRLRSPETPERNRRDLVSSMVTGNCWRLFWNVIIVDSTRSIQLFVVLIEPKNAYVHLFFCPFYKADEQSFLHVVDTLWIILNNHYHVLDLVMFCCRL